MARLDEIINTLYTLRSEDRAAKSGTMCPTSMTVIGVTNPDLKKVMRELYAIMKAEPRDSFLGIAEQLVTARIMECQMLAWLLLEKARIVPSLTGEEAVKLKGILDNWASVDTYGVIIYGILWRMGTITDEEVLELQESNDTWERRLALVATVALNLRSRGGRGDTGRTLKVCERAVDDHEDMIVKAVSWALRSLIIWDSNSVSEFLHQHNDRLAKRVLREVNHKLEFGTKN